MWVLLIFRARCTGAVLPARWSVRCTLIERGAKGLQTTCLLLQSIRAPRKERVWHVDSGRTFDLIRRSHTPIGAILDSDCVKESKRLVQGCRLGQSHIVRQCNSHPIDICTHRIPAGMAIYAWRVSIPRFTSSGQRIQHRNRRRAGDGIQAIIGWKDERFS